MFSHIMIGANDIEASKNFYDAVLGTLGCKPGILSINTTEQKRYIYIHGTAHEDQIGERASHGCIRMKNQDIIDLFDICPLNINVLILDN